MASKARSRWIREGDQNLRFFHSLVRGRRKTNAIQGLNIQGRWVENPEEVKDEVKRFFNGKFVEENEERLKLEGVIFKRLEEGDNVLIGRPFDEKEVREAVWDCEGER